MTAKAKRVFAKAIRIGNGLLVVDADSWLAASKRDGRPWMVLDADGSWRKATVVEMAALEVLSDSPAGGAPR